MRKVKGSCYLFVLLIGFLTAFHFHSDYSNAYKIINVEDHHSTEAIKVVTYNIQYGKGQDGRVDLARIIETLKAFDADIISLQEVERFSPRSGFIDQVNRLAAELEMNAIYYPTLAYPGFYYGNAILTRYKIEDSSYLSFNSRIEARNAIIAKLTIAEDQSVYVINTHLGLDKTERADAYELLYSAMTKMELPIIFTGDLNATPKANEYERLSSLLAKSNKGLPLQTYYSRDWQIDYVFHSAHFTVEHVNAVKSEASDHFPVSALLYMSTYD